MLSGISSPFGTEMHVASVAFYTAAGLLAGRKFCLAAGCKLGAAVAGLMKKQNVAEWNQASADYLAQGKKDVVRDVAAVAGFLGVLALVVSANEVLVEREKESKYLSDKTIKGGIFLAGMGAPSILFKVVSSFNQYIKHSALCAPVNQLIVRPTMSLLNMCLGDNERPLFEGRGFLCLGGPRKDKEYKKYR